MRTKCKKTILEKEKSKDLLSVNEKELINLISIMNTVDINSVDAKLNTSSMSDSDGGRIYF